jgi:predicted Zn-dependent protease
MTAPGLFRRLVAAPLAVLPAARSAWAQGASKLPLVVIRDAEIETLLRTFANPLFRAAGLDPNLGRIVLIRDGAINSFVSTGNRMFIERGLIGG